MRSRVTKMNDEIFNSWLELFFRFMIREWHHRVPLQLRDQFTTFNHISFLGFCKRHFDLLRRTSWLVPEFCYNDLPTMGRATHTCSKCWHPFFYTFQRSRESFPLLSFWSILVFISCALIINFHRMVASVTTVHSKLLFLVCWFFTFFFLLHFEIHGFVYFLYSDVTVLAFDTSFCQFNSSTSRSGLCCR